MELTEFKKLNNELLDFLEQEGSIVITTNREKINDELSALFKKCEEKKEEKKEK